MKSIKDLAEWKYGVIAHAIEICASTEVEGKRPVDSTLNIDNAVWFLKCCMRGVLRKMKG